MTLFLSACSNDDNPAGSGSDGNNISFTATLAAPGSHAATRAAYAEDAEGIKFSWKAGDRLALVHNGIKDVVTVGQVAADGSASISGTLSKALDGEAVKVVFPEEMVIAPLEGTAYEPYTNQYLNQDGTLDFILNRLVTREADATLKVSGGKATTGSEVVTECQSAIFKVTFTDGTNPINPSTFTISRHNNHALTIPASTYATNGDGVVYYGMIPSEPHQLQLTATVGDDTYVYSNVENMPFDAGGYFVWNIGMSKVEAVQLWADGPKWASVNVGAQKPEQSGKHFAWGTVIGAESSGLGCSWTTAAYYTGDGQTHSWSKYTEGFATLEAGDDAARVAWKGQWRMPTADEMSALASPAKVTTTWTADYNGTGVAGMIITGATPGYTDKSIFLPAAGTGVEADVKDAGKTGCYWTPSLDADAQHAATLNFSQESFAPGSAPRYYGCSVRPVK